MTARAMNWVSLSRVSGLADQLTAESNRPSNNSSLRPAPPRPGARREPSQVMTHWHRRWRSGSDRQTPETPRHPRGFLVSCAGPVARARSQGGLGATVSRAPGPGPVAPSGQGNPISFPARGAPTAAHAPAEPATNHARNGKLLGAPHVPAPHGNRTGTASAVRTRRQPQPTGKRKTERRRERRPETCCRTRRAPTSAWA